MTEKLWHKSSTHLNPLIERYTVGDDTANDSVLMPYDIAASSAHVKGLARIGVLTEEEKESLLSGLAALKTEWEAGKGVMTQDDEDCHTVIERYLVAACGDTGKKVHTGRSRNDQVLVALRLYMKDMLVRIRKEAGILTADLLSFADRYRAVPLPGYSHTQQAMLSSVGHYFCSYLEALLDDIEFLDGVTIHIDKNPLGSVAGFGIALPLDRSGTTRELGFSRTQVNSLYCQTSRRKFEAATLEALSQIMQTLATMANDLILFTSREFDFFSVDESCVTGSSIMPQKRNMDVLEIVRGSLSLVRGNQMMIATIGSQLISGYHRDVQLTKKPLIESCVRTLQSIEVMREFMRHVIPNEDRIKEKMKDIFLQTLQRHLPSKKGCRFETHIGLLVTV